MTQSTPVPRTLVRCPKCLSTDAGENEARSAYEFAFMQCNACGYGGLCDHYQIKDEWNVTILLPEEAPLPARANADGPIFGCGRCLGDDAEVAWEALRTRRVKVLIDESHFDVVIFSCSCGEHAVQVFAERIDWSGGQDDQTWLLMPIALEEIAKLMLAPADDLEATVSALGAGRRFILRAWADDGKVRARWRVGGFSIPRHD